MNGRCIDKNEWRLYDYNKFEILNNILCID